MSTPTPYGPGADPFPAVTALERYILDLLAGASAVAHAADPAAREEAARHRGRLLGTFDAHCATLHRLRDAARRECRAAGYQLGEYEPVLKACSKAAVDLWGWQPPPPAGGSVAVYLPIGITGQALHDLHAIKVGCERTPGDSIPLPRPTTHAGPLPTPPDGPDPKRAGVLWWKGKRRDVPKGVVFSLIRYMWVRDSARFDVLMDGSVWDGEVTDQTVRSKASAASKVLGKAGVPWRLRVESGTVLKEPTDADV